MFISIIIPTFNSELTLSKCLDSISSQTSKDFEVILQDNLSKDRTLEIARSYINKFNIKIFSEKDFGIYDGMNLAASKSLGEYLLFLGSDDFLYNSEVIESLRNILDKLEYQADLVWGNCHVLGEKDYIKNQNYPLNSLYKNFINHQNIIFKSEAFKRFGPYKTEYRLYADQILIQEMLLKHKVTFKYLDMVISTYFPNGSSFSMTDRQYAIDIYQLQKTLFKDVDEGELIKHGNIVVTSFIETMFQKKKYSSVFTPLLGMWSINKWPVGLRHLSKKFMSTF